jgi:hypothetical protein
MADLRTDLVNELRNQKYYLEQDLVRLVSSQATSYKGRLKEIKECLVEIGKCNTGIALTDVYMPAQEQTSQGGQPAATAEAGQADDVITGNAPAPAPQPHAGQTHGE